MTEEESSYVWDARDRGRNILAFVRGKAFDDYAEDLLLRSAVERQFEIIGEAFAQLRRLSPEIAAGIPELPNVVAFRNLLIHGYAQVNDRVVWDAVTISLPILLARLDSLLG